MNSKHPDLPKRSQGTQTSISIPHDNTNEINRKQFTRRSCRIRAGAPRLKRKPPFRFRKRTISSFSVTRSHRLDRKVLRNTNNSQNGDGTTSEEGNSKPSGSDGSFLGRFARAFGSEMQSFGSVHSLDSSTKTEVTVKENMHETNEWNSRTFSMIRNKLKAKTILSSGEQGKPSTESEACDISDVVQLPDESDAKIKNVSSFRIENKTANLECNDETFAGIKSAQFTFSNRRCLSDLIQNNFTPKPTNRKGQTLHGKKSFLTSKHKSFHKSPSFKQHILSASQKTNLREKTETSDSDFLSSNPTVLSTPTITGETPAPVLIVTEMNENITPFVSSKMNGLLSKYVENKQKVTEVNNESSGKFLLRHQRALDLKQNPVALTSLTKPGSNFKSLITRQLSLLGFANKDNSVGQTLQKSSSPTSQAEIFSKGDMSNRKLDEEEKPQPVNLDVALFKESLTSENKNFRRGQAQDSSQESMLVDMPENSLTLTAGEKKMNNDLMSKYIENNKRSPTKITFPRRKRFGHSYGLSALTLHPSAKAKMKSTLVRNFKETNFKNLLSKNKSRFIPDTACKTDADKRVELTFQTPPKACLTPVVSLQNERKMNAEIPSKEFITESHVKIQEMDTSANMQEDNQDLFIRPSETVPTLITEILSNGLLSTYTENNKRSRAKSENPRRKRFAPNRGVSELLLPTNARSSMKSNVFRKFSQPTFKNLVNKHTGVHKGHSSQDVGLKMDDDILVELTLPKPPIPGHRPAVSFLNNKKSKADNLSKEPHTPEANNNDLLMKINSIPDPDNSRRLGKTDETFTPTLISRLKFQHLEVDKVKVETSFAPNLMNSPNSHLSRNENLKQLFDPDQVKNEQSFSPTLIPSPKSQFPDFEQIKTENDLKLNVLKSPKSHLSDVDHFKSPLETKSKSLSSTSLSKWQGKNKSPYVGGTKKSFMRTSMGSQKSYNSGLNHLKSPINTKSKSFSNIPPAKACVRDNSFELAPTICDSDISSCEISERTRQESLEFSPTSINLREDKAFKGNVLASHFVQGKQPSAPANLIKTQSILKVLTSRDSKRIGSEEKDDSGTQTPLKPSNSTSHVRVHMQLAGEIQHKEKPKPTILGNQESVISENINFPGGRVQDHYQKPAPSNVKKICQDPQNDPFTSTPTCLEGMASNGLLSKYIEDKGSLESNISSEKKRLWPNRGAAVLTVHSGVKSKKKPDKVGEFREPTFKNLVTRQIGVQGTGDRIVDGMTVALAAPKSTTAYLKNFLWLQNDRKTIPEALSGENPSPYANSNDLVTKGNYIPDANTFPVSMKTETDVKPTFSEANKVQSPLKTQCELSSDNFLSKKQEKDSSSKVCSTATENAISVNLESDTTQQDSLVLPSQKNNPCQDQGISTTPLYSYLMQETGSSESTPNTSKSGNTPLQKGTETNEGDLAGQGMKEGWPFENKTSKMQTAICEISTRVLNETLHREKEISFVNDDIAEKSKYSTQKSQHDNVMVRKEDSPVKCLNEFNKFAPLEVKFPSYTLPDTETSDSESMPNYMPKTKQSMLERPPNGLSTFCQGTQQIKSKDKGKFRVLVYKNRFSPSIIARGKNRSETKLMFNHRDRFSQLKRWKENDKKYNCKSYASWITGIFPRQILKEGGSERKEYLSKDSFQCNIGTSSERDLIETSKLIKPPLSELSAQNEAKNKDVMRFNNESPKTPERCISPTFTHSQIIGMKPQSPIAQSKHEASPSKCLPHIKAVLSKKSGHEVSSKKAIRPSSLKRKKYFLKPSFTQPTIIWEKNNVSNTVSPTPEAPIDTKMILWTSTPTKSSSDVDLEMKHKNISAQEMVSSGKCKEETSPSKSLSHIKADLHKDGEYKAISKTDSPLVWSKKFDNEQFMEPALPMEEKDVLSLALKSPQSVMVSHPVSLTSSPFKSTSDAVFEVTPLKPESKSLLEASPAQGQSPIKANLPKEGESSAVSKTESPSFLSEIIKQDGLDEVSTADNQAKKTMLYSLNKDKEDTKRHVGISNTLHSLSNNVLDTKAKEIPKSTPIDGKMSAYLELLSKHYLGVNAELPKAGGIGNGFATEDISTDTLTSARICDRSISNLASQEKNSLVLPEETNELQKIKPTYYSDGLGNNNQDGLNNFKGTHSSINKEKNGLTTYNIAHRDKKSCKPIKRSHKSILSRDSNLVAGKTFLSNLDIFLENKRHKKAMHIQKVENSYFRKKGRSIMKISPKNNSFLNSVAVRQERFQAVAVLQSLANTFGVDLMTQRPNQNDSVELSKSEKEELLCKAVQVIKEKSFSNILDNNLPKNNVLSTNECQSYFMNSKLDGVVNERGHNLNRTHENNGISFEKEDEEQKKKDFIVEQTSLSREDKRKTSVNVSGEEQMNLTPVIPSRLNAMSGFTMECNFITSLRDFIEDLINDTPENEEMTDQSKTGNESYSQSVNDEPEMAKEIGEMTKPHFLSPYLGKSTSKNTKGCSFLNVVTKNTVQTQFLGDMETKTNKELASKSQSAEKIDNQKYSRLTKNDTERGGKLITKRVSPYPEPGWTENVPDTKDKQSLPSNWSDSPQNRRLSALHGPDETKRKLSPSPSWSEHVLRGGSQSIVASPRRVPEKSVDGNKERAADPNLFTKSKNASKSSSSVTVSSSENWLDVRQDNKVKDIPKSKTYLPPSWSEHAFDQSPVNVQGMNVGEKGKTKRSPQSSPRRSEKIQRQSPVALNSKTEQEDKAYLPPSWSESAFKNSPQPFLRSGGEDKRADNSYPLPSWNKSSPKGSFYANTPCSRKAFEKTSNDKVKTRGGLCHSPNVSENRPEHKSSSPFESSRKAVVQKKEDNTGSKRVNFYRPPRRAETSAEHGFQALFESPRKERLLPERKSYFSPSLSKDEAINNPSKFDTSQGKTPERKREGESTTKSVPSIFEDKKPPEINVISGSLKRSMQAKEEKRSQDAFDNKKEPVKQGRDIRKKTFSVNPGVRKNSFSDTRENIERKETQGAHTIQRERMRSESFERKRQIFSPTREDSVGYIQGHKTNNGNLSTHESHEKNSSGNLVKNNVSHKQRGSCQPIGLDSQGNHPVSKTQGRWRPLTPSPNRETSPQRRRRSSFERSRLLTATPSPLPINIKKQPQKSKQEESNKLREEYTPPLKALKFEPRVSSSKRRKSQQAARKRSSTVEQSSSSKSAQSSGRLGERGKTLAKGHITSSNDGAHLSENGHPKSYNSRYGQPLIESVYRSNTRIEGLATPRETPVSSPNEVHKGHQMNLTQARETNSKQANEIDSKQSGESNFKRISESSSEQAVQSNSEADSPWRRMKYIKSFFSRQGNNDAMNQQENSQHVTNGPTDHSIDNLIADKKDKKQALLDGQVTPTYAAGKEQLAVGILTGKNAKSEAGARRSPPLNGKRSAASFYCSSSNHVLERNARGNKSLNTSPMNNDSGKIKENIYNFLLEWKKKNDEYFFPNVEHLEVYERSINALDLFVNEKAPKMSPVSVSSSMLMSKSETCASDKDSITPVPSLTEMNNIHLQKGSTSSHPETKEPMRAENLTYSFKTVEEKPFTQMKYETGFLVRRSVTGLDRPFESKNNQNSVESYKGLEPEPVLSTPASIILLTSDKKDFGERNINMMDKAAPEVQSEICENKSINGFASDIFSKVNSDCSSNENQTVENLQTKTAAKPTISTGYMGSETFRQDKQKKNLDTADNKSVNALSQILKAAKETFSSYVDRQESASQDTGNVQQPSANKTSLSNVSFSSNADTNNPISRLEVDKLGDCQELSGVSSCINNMTGVGENHKAQSGSHKESSSFTECPQNLPNVMSNSEFLNSSKVMQAMNVQAGNLLCVMHAQSGKMTPIAEEISDTQLLTTNTPSSSELNSEPQQPEKVSSSVGEPLMWATSVASSNKTSSSLKNNTTIMHTGGTTLIGDLSHDKSKNVLDTLSSADKKESSLLSLILDYQKEDCMKTEERAQDECSSLPCLSKYNITGPRQEAKDKTKNGITDHKEHFGGCDNPTKEGIIESQTVLKEYKMIEPKTETAELSLIPTPREAFTGEKEPELIHSMLQEFKSNCEHIIGDKRSRTPSIHSGSLQSTRLSSQSTTGVYKSDNMSRRSYQGRGASPRHQTTALGIGPIRGSMSKMDQLFDKVLHRRDTYEEASGKTNSYSDFTNSMGSRSQRTGPNTMDYNARHGDKKNQGWMYESHKKYMHNSDESAQRKKGNVGDYDCSLTDFASFNDKRRGLTDTPCSLEYCHYGREDLSDTLSELSTVSSNANRRKKISKNKRGTKSCSVNNLQRPSHPWVNAIRNKINTRKSRDLNAQTVQQKLDRRTSVIRRPSMTWESTMTSRHGNKSGNKLQDKGAKCKANESIVPPSCQYYGPGKHFDAFQTHMIEDALRLEEQLFGNFESERHFDNFKFGSISSIR